MKIVGGHTPDFILSNINQIEFDLAQIELKFDLLCKARNKLIERRNGLLDDLYNTMYGDLPEPGDLTEREARLLLSLDRRYYIKAMEEICAHIEDAKLALVFDCVDLEDAKQSRYRIDFSIEPKIEDVLKSIMSLLPYMNYAGQDNRGAYKQFAVGWWFQGPTLRIYDDLSCMLVSHKPNHVHNVPNIGTDNILYALHGIKHEFPGTRDFLTDCEWDND